MVILKNRWAATFLLWPGDSPVESEMMWLTDVNFFTLVFRLHDFKAYTSEKVYKYRLD